MIRKYKWLLLAGFALIGAAAAGYLLMARTIPMTVDGVTTTIKTRALTVRGALRSAGYPPQEGDLVIPAAGEWLSRAASIELVHPREVSIELDPSGEVIKVTTASLTPMEILSEAELEPAEEDLVLVNGQPAGLNDWLDAGIVLALRYRRAVTLEIDIDGETRTLRSAADDLGSALVDAGIEIIKGDRVSLDLSTPLEEGLVVEIRKGRPFEIMVDGGTTTGYSAALTTGEALADAGIALQGLDYSQPAEEEPAPQDGVIRVVRVVDIVMLEKEEIPFETIYQADETLEINDRQVTQEGVKGVSAKKVEVRYQDGEEVSRGEVTEVTLSEPLPQVINYGTRLVYQTIDTPNGPVTYYLAVEGTATSYSPCNSGTGDTCHPLTASGVPVTRGIVAMHRDWYNLFKGYNVYVEGYGIGTVADIGYYPYDDNWIDLGYTDAEYVSWGSPAVTIYFLPPAPPDFTGVLP